LSRFCASFAAKDGDKMRALLGEVTRVDTAGYTALARICAERFDSESEALPYVVWILENSGDSKQVAWSIDTLSTNHAHRPELLPAFRAAMSGSRGRHKGKLGTLVDRIIETNKDLEVLANAYFTRGTYFSGDPEDLAKVFEIAPESILALRLQSSEFEKTRLQIGMTAPEIEGTGTDGAPIKLSEYRGRVVVLQFWGDW
jgi:hypothetical protein